MIERGEAYKDLFLSEARQHVGAMNKAILALEKLPKDTAPIRDCMRACHTLKGMSATMAYGQTERLCHAIETVLEAVKKQVLPISSCADTFFKCLDTLEETLKRLKAGEKENATTQLVRELEKIAMVTRGRDIKTTSPAPEMEDHEPLEVKPLEKVQTIEVKVERMDRLLNLAEELLINKMRLDRSQEALKNAELSAAVDSLGRLVADLQYTVMQARTVPVDFIFNRFPRMVRDLAKSEHKEVELTLSGGDIELDRAVIDEIGESLVHLLRNGIDHGIETPDERRAQGKPPLATIQLLASRTKDFAVIQVIDDGRGLDLDEIRKTAVRREVLRSNATAEEVMNAIFSEVSTKKQVTDVSGRGVGLGVVKKKIESLGGRVRVASEPKKSTTFTLEIPFTLAVIKSLFIQVGSRQYAIPVSQIERLVTVPASEIKGLMEYEAIIVDEEEVPLTRLSDLFGEPAKEHERYPIVIVSRGEESLGLVVDALLVTQEMVIKPLNRAVKESRYFAGSTITGSGEVVLVLDVGNLVLSKRAVMRV
jgi:two-component system, chemotaxis family, sensor kinase CheA